MAEHVGASGRTLENLDDALALAAAVRAVAGAAGTDPAGGLAELARQAELMLGCDAASIHVAEGQGDDLVFRRQHVSAFGAARGAMDTPTWRVPDALQPMLRTGSSLYVADFPSTATQDIAERPWLRDIASALYAPLIAAGAPLGVLFLAWHSPRSADPVTVALAEELARCAAVVIRTARMAQALAAARERSRVAMDLHDGAIQSLFGLAMLLGGAERRTEPGTDAHATLAYVRTEIEAAIEHVRSHVMRLRGDERTAQPALRAQLDALAQEVRRTTGTIVRLRLAPTALGRFTDDEARELAYATREAVSNAVRHGGAKTVQVSLHAAPTRTTLRVRDDGGGFHRSDVEPGDGLLNLTARAARLRGTVVVTRAAGGGTIVRVVVPYAALSELASFS